MPDLIRCILTLLLLIISASANVEKIVFMHNNPQAVEPKPLPHNAKHLEVLSPSNPSLRRDIHATFASSEAWLLLEGLQQGSRYEVRVCWSATVSHGNALHGFVQILPYFFESKIFLSNLLSAAHSFQARLTR